MLTLESAEKEGLEVCHLAAKKFWHGNRAKYERAVIGLEDLEGHLVHYILVARYLTTVRTNPGYYPTIERFRSSLYTSCHRASLAHYRKHVRSEKRGLALVAGAMVCLDAEPEEGLPHQLATYDPHGVMDRLTASTGSCLLDRVLTFLRFGGSWEDIAPRFTSPEVVKRHLVDHLVLAH